MRIPTNNSTIVALWSDLDPIAVTAIELATGLDFYRCYPPPAGLRRQVDRLKSSCNTLWPDLDYTVGDMARQYLAMQADVSGLDLMEDAHGQTRGPTDD